METRTEKLLSIIKNLSFENITRTQIELLSKEASEILEEDFKKEVVKTFNFLENNWCKDNLEPIKTGDKVRFVYDSYYHSEGRTFLNKHIEKVEKIMAILKEEYCKEEGELNG